MSHIASPPVTELSPDDLAHHRYLVDQHNMSQSALDSWGRYVLNKYQLTPSDGISSEGKIIRSAMQSEQNGKQETPDTPQ